MSTLANGDNSSFFLQNACFWGLAAVVCYLSLSLSLFCSHKNMFKKKMSQLAFSD
jgi:hypothetical protein